MRILQVIHDFLPRHNAGSELYCFHLSRELARRHDVSVLYAEVDHARPRHELRRSSYRGLPLYEVNRHRAFRRFEDTYADREMDRIFERVLDEVRPDVVHLHHLLNHSIGYIPAARRRGIPVVFTLHDYWLTCPNGGQRIRPDEGVCEEIDVRDCAGCIRQYEGAAGLASRMAAAAAASRGPAGRVPAPAVARSLARAVRRALPSSPVRRRASKARARLERVLAACADVDLFLAPSRFLRDEMVRFGLPPQRVVHSDVAVPSAPFEGFSRAPSEALRFGYVGTLAPHKGVHILVDAFRRLCEAHRSGRTTLRLHGSPAPFPDYAARLRRMAAGAPVELCGEFDHDRVREIYAGLDVLVVPSIWWENSPLTVHEAILTRTPAIVSDYGGMAEMVRHGENGLRFRVGDAVDLARQMSYLLEDPNRLGQLRSPAFAVKSVEQDAREMEGRYATLIGTPAATGTVGRA